MEEIVMVKWVSKNWLIILILVIGAFLRLYKIDGYMTFLGDEGRDAIIVRNLLVKADPILIGPGTSVGGMYLGPLYYYFMAPFLLLANFSPVGPAIGVALLGVATIYLVYLAGFEWFSKTAGLISSSLFAISPTVITLSHSSWNPNIMPFFALLSVYAIWKAYTSRVASREVGWWLIICAISFAFVLQSHYLGLLLAPVLFIYWFLSKPKTYIQYTIYSILIFLFLMSPLLAFDIRHDWMNSRALYKFLTVRDETVSITPWTAIPKIYPIFEQVSGSMLTVKNELIGKLISILLLVSSMFALTKKSYKNRKSIILILVWLVFGLIGFGLYKQNVYDHYFGFLFPVPFLLIGATLQEIYKTKYKLVSVLIFGFLVILNLSSNPFKYQPNYQMQRAKNVSTKVLEITQGKPFNLAVLAERNYEDGYRYFMDVSGATVLHADRWDKNTISEVLMVICEKEENKCDPTHSAKAEVANFGWSKIEDKWIVDGVIIYKLVHSK
jgi:4-amino-4-deoxy-L-arabinose transferase-like glycosyltransferase